MISRYLKNLRLLPVVCGLALSTDANANQPDETDYFQLMYDFEVAGYCGLVTEPIVQATRTKRDEIEATGTLPEDELRKIRIAAFVAADKEYQNRSLGGHKAWCESDGTAGVRRILTQ